MDYTKIITIEPGKRSGKPCIRGLRITVSEVLGYLASGMTEDQILEDFPDLTREDIRACLAFAADRERSELACSTIPMGSACNRWERRSTQTELNSGQISWHRWWKPV